MMRVRDGTDLDLERAKAFYRRQRRGSDFAPDDFLLLAENDDQELVGIVRLCHEYRHLVLRGMLVDRAYRHRGLGTQMLRALEKHLVDQECYCLPWAHLEDFYHRIGFELIATNKLPVFLQQRLAEHGAQMRNPRIQLLMQDDLGIHPPEGLTLIAMKRPSG